MKQGRQKGHDGHTLGMVENPDHIVICKPNICTCGQDLFQQPMSIVASRQVFDLPEPLLEITEYQIAQVFCPVCGQSHRGEFPSDIKAPTQYGTGVKALVTLLNSEYKLPFEKIQTLFGDLYGYAINVGTIIAANATCYDKLADTEALIQEKISSSRVVNSDESGVRCNGKLHWLHVASISFFTYLFVHQKRGKEAIESDTSILKRFFGWLVHDCWSSYFNLTHLKHAQLEEPQPTKTGSKGRHKRTKGRNLLKRLQKFKPAVLAFAFHAEVPFTNNQAERDIRPIKVKQKISGCFRTFKGAEHYARSAGFIATTRKHKLNVSKELCNVFEGYSFLTIEQLAK